MTEHRQPLSALRTLSILTGVGVLAFVPWTGVAWAAEAVEAESRYRFVSDNAIHTGLHILYAILLFIGGWILAKLAEFATLQLLSRTRLDNKIAEKLHLDLLWREHREPEERALERFLASVAFWVVMLLVVVAVLEFAGLPGVARPIGGFVDTVAQAIPRILKAGLILLVAYVAGWILQKLVTVALERLALDRRFAELSADPADRGTPFSVTVGRVVFWLVMLAGLAGAFEALEIGSVAQPLHNALEGIVGFLPEVIAAALILFAGWFGGKILRVLLRNILHGLGFDRLVSRFGLDRLAGRHTPSDLVGIIVMVFVVIQAVIAALNRLELHTLAGPLTSMMAQFWNLLPALLVSIAILVVGVFVGRLLRGVVAGGLRNLGFDDFMARVGFRKLSDRRDRLGEYSEMVGYGVQIAVVLVAIAQALANIDLVTWALYVNEVLAYFLTSVVVAVVVVAIGFAIGNYVRDLIYARSDDEEAGRWLAEFARYAVLVFAFTAAVRQLDVAEDFVLLTFGLLFGALCLAAGLAFGLGGREVASDILKRRYDEARRRVNRPKPPTPTTGGPLGGPTGGPLGGGGPGPF